MLKYIAVTNDSSASGMYMIRLENAYLNTLRYFSEIKNGTLGMLDGKHKKMIESPVVF